MKHRTIYLGMILLSIFSFNGQSQQNEELVLRGPYLGQKPPGMKPEIFAPGLISIEGSAEYGAHFSPDLTEFYFTRNTPDARAAIWVLKKTKDIWSEPKVIEFMDDYRGSESCISFDGKNFFYVWVNKTSESVEMDIYKAVRNANGWSKPERLTDVDLGFRRVSPSVASNGNLYFSGDYDKSGQKDIYVSEFQEGEYSTPVNLGEKVNSEYHESHVFVSPDERFIVFDSDRSNGNGQSDIYISFKTEGGSWGEAQNLGAPVNGEYSEWYPTVTPDGKFLMFSRNAEGLADIMWVDIKVVEALKSIK